MKIFVNIWKLLLATVFLAWLVFFFFPGSLRPPETTIEYRYDTLPGDSVPVYIPGDSVPYPVHVHHYHSETITVTIDTAAILADYYSVYSYRDTLTDDSTFLAILKEDISRNRIIDRRFWHQALRGDVKITETINRKEDPGWMFYGGISLLAGADRGAGLGPSALIIPPGNSAFGITYDITSKTLTGTGYIDIGSILKKDR